MYIHEAINAALTTPENGFYITRRAWTANYFISKPSHGAPAKLMLTATPDKLVYISGAEPHYRPNWSPTFADLVADDWEVCW